MQLTFFHALTSRAAEKLQETKMRIELSQAEVDTLQQALECWEKDAGTGELFGSLLGMMLCRSEEEKAKEKLRAEDSRKKADDESRRRKMKSMMLRAKLAQSVTAMLTQDKAT